MHLAPLKRTHENVPKCRLVCNSGQGPFFTVEQNMIDSYFVSSARVFVSRLVVNGKNTSMWGKMGTLYWSIISQQEYISRFKLECSRLLKYKIMFSSILMYNLSLRHANFYFWQMSNQYNFLYQLSNEKWFASFQKF